MDRCVQLLDVVALMGDIPDRGLVGGQVGTVVEVLGTDVYEVEFSDNEGCTYDILALRADQLMLLHHQPVKAA